MKVLMMAASLVTMRGISVAIGLLLTPGKVRRRPIRSDKKSMSDEGMISMGRELARPFLAKFQGCDRRLHVRPVFRESVEESRDEHVARQAAEWVEMNVQKSSPNFRRRPISNAKYSAFTPGADMRYRGGPGCQRVVLFMSEMSRRARVLE
jgi:hypothetical protein